MMTPLQRMLILSLVTATVSAVPGPAPIAPIGATLFHVTPSVRRIVRDVRLLDIPLAYRRKNWTGNRGQVSCVHAAFVHLLHWQGQHDMAQWWAAHRANGETAESMATNLEAVGLRSHSWHGGNFHRIRRRLAGRKNGSGHLPRAPHYRTKNHARI